ncbi:MFS transporter [Bailinhaonella thermotolerans]|uniref:MFS transporter n=1 Tax=Bailinhaonella thermotolerans TaxID=1070861 RepID=A0A3A4B7S8_9ACTN|nr:MFS transporter [Bailinhaonella thermotolerans]RJL33544.1 MFS transporter [Bailinhaonella thermotolerans]
MRTGSPWGASGFRTLFAGAAFSQFGVNVGYIAVPLIAVTALGAGAGQVGVLSALSTVAFLVIGLPAGAWIDRMRHRRVLIAADLVRAALYLSIPVAWWLGVLTLGQLYAVVVLYGCATVFFDIASQSVLPQLVGRDRLVPANSAVMTLIALANIGGRGAGGAIVQFLTAPVAAASTAVAHLVAALRLSALPPTPPPAAPARRASLRAQISEGVRHVFGVPELRALALTATFNNLGSQIVNTMLPIVFVRDLGYPAGTLGLFWMAGGAGLLAGARLARPLAVRLGPGRALVFAGPVMAPAALLLPLVDRGAGLWLAGAGYFLAMAKTGMDNVLGVTLRQRMTPDPLLGRMNATFRTLLTGALALGAAAAGLIGELTAVRPALWTGAIVLSLAFLPVTLSPLRSRGRSAHAPGEATAAR